MDNMEQNVSRERIPGTKGSCGCRLGGRAHHLHPYPAGSWGAEAGREQVDKIRDRREVKNAP